MQISRVEVMPVELNLRLPFRSAYHPSPVDRVGVVFVRVEMVRRKAIAWGCAAFDPAITGETMEKVTQVCHACADRVRSLSPIPFG